MRPAIFLTALAAALAAGAASAQTPKPTELDTLVVTATRSGQAQDADRIGGSVTVLSPEILERRQLRDVSDILRDVPGAAVSRIPGQTQVRLRGTEGNHTLVLIDGIEVSDPFAGEFDFGSLIADDAARVEVLRGQQSALYGSDAIGGVIHYMTSTGREAPGASVRIEGGSFGAFSAAGRIAGVSGDFDTALSASLVTTDGAPNARGGVRDLDRMSGAVSLKSTWSPASHLRLTAVGRFARTEDDFNDSDTRTTSPTFGYIIDSPGVRFENRAFYGLLRGEGDLLEDRWTHAVSAQVADFQREGFNLRGRSSGNEGRRTKGSYETTMRFGDATARQRLTLAIDAERETFRNTDPSGFAFAGRRRLENLGLVGEYGLDLNDAAAVSASVRHDANDRFRDATTWRVQGSYLLETGTRLRAAAGSGVKNPGFYELYGFVDGRFIGNPNLKPERSEGWELGVEQALAEDGLLIGVTYFDSRLKDEIFTTFPPPRFIASPANRATVSKQRGIETFVRAQLAPAWRIDAVYTNLRARENGVKEVRRPNNIASLAVDWRAPADKGGINLVVRYTGRQTDLAFINRNFVPSRVTLDDYTLVNLSGELKVSARLALFGRVENLFSADYEEVFSFANPGRTTYVGLRARF
ncbi:MAG: TonB-dependent receptor plug domain-containing protein [Alphaproteobacteria bacterium]